MVNDDSNYGKTPDFNAQDESVDEILSEILNKDGSFNKEFGNLLTKYLGDDAAHVASLRGIDLSDRADEPRYRQRVEYEDPDIRSPYGTGLERDYDRRIEQKMPEDVRYMYSEAAANAQRPEFTSNGNVRYPAMGVGASEERVVYDAEWEERARQEAARLQRVREDRMLRGDSTYVRSFVANGRPMRGGQGRSPYIDPLSDDEDFDNTYRYEQRRQDDRQSFFQEGPPAAKARNRAGRQRNVGGAGGRTDLRRVYGDGYASQEDVFDSFSDEYEREQAAKAAWLQPDEPNASGKRRRNDRRRGQRPQMTSTLRDDYDRMSILRESDDGRPVRQIPVQPETLTQPPRMHKRPEQPERPEQPKAPELPEENKEPAPQPEELFQAERETRGLRSTVAEIVDKYNKRNEEEQARQEAERREREAFLNGLPAEIAAALNEENAASPLSEIYDDFTDAHPSEAAPQTDSLRDFAAAHAEKNVSQIIAAAAEEQDAQDLPDEGYDDFSFARPAKTVPEEYCPPEENDATEAPDAEDVPATEDDNTANRTEEP